MLKAIVFLLSLGLLANCNGAADTPKSTLTQTDTYTSCTSAESQPELPILSFAKSSLQFSFEFTCDALFSALRPVTITWYYYSEYPPSDCVPAPNKCCHSTADSKIEFISSGGGAGGSNTLITRYGKVVDGPYKGKKVEQTYLIASTDQAACISKQGLELRSGNAVLTIIGGPVCTGNVLSQFCPGLHLAPPASFLGFNTTDSSTTN